MGFRLQAKEACVQSECGAVARQVRSVRTAETERAEERRSRPSAPVWTSSGGRPSRSGRGLAAHARRGGQATRRTGAAASRMERAEGSPSSSCLPAARAVPSARSRELASDGMGSSSSSAACKPRAAQTGPRTRTAWAADTAASAARAACPVPSPPRRAPRGSTRRRRGSELPHWRGCVRSRCRAPTAAPPAPSGSLPTSAC
mmetsp:Transcript_37041/g.121124  ORF Transcript_37041/g.121124 Transcript_37041/m.121124 type:complete len:202 (+) Transcript_37041:786-1391(+)